MTGTIEARLRDKGIELPEAAAPAANYAPFMRMENAVFISGQLPRWNNELKVTGKLGGGLTVAQGVDAARLCALNMVAHIRNACDGDLDRVRQCVQLTGIVACTPDFTEHATVLNGGSDVIFEVFGPEIGNHSRIATGANVLPFDAAVEFHGVFLVV